MNGEAESFMEEREHLMKLTKVIAVTSLKGGVGKTTSAVNIAACFAERGLTTLLLDMDPHTGATLHLGLDFKSLELTAYDLLLDQEIVLRDVACKTHWENLFLIPSTGTLSELDTRLEGQVGREHRLSEKFQDNLNAYDAVVIDAPPVASLLLYNVLCAARFAVVPFRTDYMSTKAIDDMDRLVKGVAKRLNPDIDILGYFGTMYDRRTKESEACMKEMKDAYGTKVFDTVIPSNAVLARAARHGSPGIEYARDSEGARSYELLSDEILSRC